MKRSQYGPCGLFCGACAAQDCGGCLSDDIDEYVLKCKFRNCVKERNVEFCCFCEEYPCAELHNFMNDKWPHHWTMESNLEYIKKHGIEKWIQAQQKEWTCDDCGEPIYWYQKECGCGRRFEAWKVPE